MRTSKLAIALLSSGILLTINVQADDDREVKQSDVPQVVLDAFAIAKPKIKVREYEMKTHDGKLFYELEYKVNGVKHEYYYSADGTLLETGEEFYPSRLPAELKKAIKTSYPKAKIKGVKKKTMADGNASGFEVELQENGKEVELDIDANGKITRVDLDD